ncbi:DUF2715 domain-containing protein [Treponema sp. HNW]|uniref:DUF2715 domain-containing protein n=1 Tax=Treponema sp. HNW TaxID=3116654 RepID=UPI003D152D4B
MKKIVVGLLCVMLVSGYCFAEFVITPTIGFSDFSLNGQELSASSSSGSAAKTSLSSFAVSLDLGVIAEKGFTFLWDHNLSFGGKMKSRFGNLGEVSLKTSGALYEGNLLFGYTFKGIENLYINLAAGFGNGIGVMTIEEVNGSKPVTVERIGIVTGGIPIHFGAQYFFTKNIGLNLSIMGIPSFGFTMRPFDFADLINELSGIFFDSYASSHGYPSSSSSSSPTSFQMGFTNIFLVKIGPVFKF